MAGLLDDGDLVPSYSKMNIDWLEVVCKCIAPGYSNLYTVLLLSVGAISISPPFPGPFLSFLLSFSHSESLDAKFKAKAIQGYRSTL